MIDLLNSVFIDYCFDCDQHDWCTSHNQEKYFYYYNTLKQEIEKEYIDIKVYANVDPLTGKKRAPALGAFEVKFQYKTVFSKLDTRTWPSFNLIVDKIGAIKLGLTSFVSSDSKTSTDQREPRSRSNPRHQRGLSQNSRPETRNNHRRLVTRSPETTEHSMFETRPISRNTSQKKEPSYLPFLRSPFNKTTTEGRVWPKTKFYRRDKSPLRLHALRDAPFDVSMFTDKEKVKNLSPSSTKVTDTTRVETMKTMPNFTSHPISRDISQKDSLGAIDSLKFLRSSKTGPKRDPSKSRYSQTNEAAEYNLDETLEGNPAKGALDSHKLDLENIEKPLSPTPEEPKSDVMQIGSASKTPEVRSSVASLEERAQEKVPNQDIPHPVFITAPQSETVSTNPLITCTTLRGDHKEENADENGNKENLESFGDIKNYIFSFNETTFPEKKVSVIQVPKERGTKKKITVHGDEHIDCTVKIHSPNPKILNMELTELFLPKGEVAKISLKFEPRTEEKVEEYVLFLLKDDHPWLRIVIQANYV